MLPSLDGSRDVFFCLLVGKLNLRVFVVPDFCRSSFEGYEGDEAELQKRKEADEIKEERYNGSPPAAETRDIYNTEQLVPAPASYQPYR